MEKPKAGEPPSPPAAQQPEETDSPQSPLPDEEGEVDIQPHQQKMLVQFPFQKKKAAGLRRTPSKESTGRFGVSSDKEDDSVVTVSDDGSDPNGASTSTGRTIPSSRKKRSREGETIRCATYEETSRRRRDCTPTGSEPACQNSRGHSHCNRNELYGKDNPPVQEVRARLLGLDPDVTLPMPRLMPHHGSLFARRRWRGMHQDIITDHWIPYLEENDRLADCSPEEFNATEGWVPLYTPEKLEEHLPAALSAFGSAKPPCLTGGCTPKLPPRHGQRVHANELSPKGMPAEDVPDDKREAEAGRLLPILWRH